MAVPLPLDHKVNHPEVAALDDQRAPRGGKGQLLHRRYVVVQNLHMAERDGQLARERERQKGSSASGFSSLLIYFGFIKPTENRPENRRQTSRAAVPTAPRAPRARRFTQSNVLKGFAGAMVIGSSRPEKAAKKKKKLHASSAHSPSEPTSHPATVERDSHVE